MLPPAELLLSKRNEDLFPSWSYLCALLRENYAGVSQCRTSSPKRASSEALARNKTFVRRRRRVRRRNELLARPSLMQNPAKAAAAVIRMRPHSYHLFFSSFGPDVRSEIARAAS